MTKIQSFCRDLEENPFEKFEILLPEQPFSKLLKKMDVPMSYNQVRAYTLGVVIGLEFLPPSHVASEILQQDTDDEIGIKNKSEAKRFFSLFTELWNQLIVWEADSPPIFEPSPNHPDQKTQNSLLGFTLFRRRAEAYHFLMGLLETNTHRDTITIPEAQAAFEWLEEYSERLELLCLDVVADFSNSKNIREPFCHEIRNLLSEGDHLWPAHFLAFRDGLRRQGETSLESHELFDDAHDNLNLVGRNELCVCGNGKTFLKCCLQ